MLKMLKMKEFVKKCREVVTETRNWNSLTPKKKFTLVVKYAQYGSHMIVYRLLGDCEIHWYSYFPLWIYVVYIVLAIYTFLVHVMAGQFKEGVACFAIFGLYTSAILSYIPGMTSERFRIRQNVLYPGTYIYTDNRDVTKLNKFLSNNIQKTVKEIAVCLIIAILSVIIGAIGPVYTYFQEGILYTLTGVLIPFVEKGSTLETALNAIYQAISAYTAIFGFLGILITTNLFADRINVGAGVTALDVDVLSKELEKHFYTKVQIKRKLIKIIKQIQIIDELTSETADHYYWYFFLSPSILIYSVGLSIYTQMIMGIPTGYGVAVMSYVQMIVMCIMGQRAVDRNDHLNFIFYDFKWYLLPDLKSRLYISMLLNRLQNGVVFTMGPFDTLSYGAASLLTQRIHSFLMFLINFGR